MGNWIKGLISYTFMVGIPILCVGITSAATYGVGYDQGKKEAIAESDIESKEEAKEE